MVFFILNLATPIFSIFLTNSAAEIEADFVIPNNFNQVTISGDINAKSISTISPTGNWTDSTGVIDSNGGVYFFTSNPSVPIVNPTETPAGTGGGSGPGLTLVGKGIPVVEDFNVLVDENVSLPDAVFGVVFNTASEHLDLIRIVSLVLVVLTVVTVIGLGTMNKL